MSVVESDSDIDDTIHCFYTLSNYTEDILGYGISYDSKKNHFSTPGELISYEAFFESNIRQSAVLKIPFDYFIPAFINLRHCSQGCKLVKSENTNNSNSDDSKVEDESNGSDNKIALNLHKTKWFDCLSSSMNSLSRADGLPAFFMSQKSVYLTSDENKWIKILCKLINDMLVQIMSGDKHGSLKLFEALCSFWRTLYWYVHESGYSQTESRNVDKSTVNVPGSLEERLVERLYDFVMYEDSRHKNYEPDLGYVFIIYGIVTDLVKRDKNNDKGFEIESMIDGYVFEANVRRVRWWKQKGISVNESQKIFENTEIGRNLFVFQCLFLVDVVGMGKGYKNDRKLAFFDKYGVKTDDHKDNTDKIEDNDKDKDKDSDIAMVVTTETEAESKSGDNTKEMTSYDTARCMDDTNGQLPKYLELIQQDFKIAKELINTFVKFWEFIGVSDNFMSYHGQRDISEFIKMGVKIAKKKGARYYPKRLLMQEKGNNNNNNNNTKNKSDEWRNHTHDDVFDVYKQKSSGGSGSNNSGDYREYRSSNYPSRDSHSDSHSYSYSYSYSQQNRGSGNRYHSNANSNANYERGNRNYGYNQRSDYRNYNDNSNYERGNRDYGNSNSNSSSNDYGRRHGNSNENSSDSRYHHHKYGDRQQSYHP